MDARAVELRRLIIDEGKSQSQAAAELGIPIGTVRSTCHRAKIKPGKRGRPHTAHRRVVTISDEELLAAYEENGANGYATARALGMSPQTLHRHLVRVRSL